MKRLFRTTLYTEANSLETRVAQLERRIIPGMCSWAYVARTTNQTISAASIQRIEWDEFSTNAPGLFGTIASGSSLPFHNTAGDPTLKVAHSGYVFSAVGFAQFEPDATPYEHGVRVAHGLLDQYTQGWQSNPSFGPMTRAETFVLIQPDSAGVFDTLLGVSNPFFEATAGAIFNLEAQNGDVSDRDVLLANMTVFAWPIGDNADVDPRIYP